MEPHPPYYSPSQGVRLITREVGTRLHFYDGDDFEIRWRITAVDGSHLRGVIEHVDGPDGENSESYEWRLGQRIYLDEQDVDDDANPPSENCRAT